MKAYFVYILTNKGRTVLYTGVTNSLVRRVSQHRRAEVDGFTRLYNVNRLMHYECFNDIREAIAREKQIKGWTRAKKEALISLKNPGWSDLSSTVLGLGAVTSARSRSQRSGNDVCHPERSEGSRSIDSA